MSLVAMRVLELKSMALMPLAGEATLARVQPEMMLPVEGKTPRLSAEPETVDDEVEEVEFDDELLESSPELELSPELSSELELSVAEDEDADEVDVADECFLVVVVDDDDDDESPLSLPLPPDDVFTEAVVSTPEEDEEDPDVSRAAH